MKPKMSPQEKNRLIMVIVCASLLIVAQNFVWYFTTGRPYVELLRNTPKKIYKPTLQPQSHSPAETEASGTSSELKVDIETSSDAKGNSIEPESLEVSPNSQGTNDARESNEDDVVPPKQETSQHDHSHEDHPEESATSKALKAEVRADMQAATELLESSMAQLKDTMPLFVNELSKKSVEEQRTFLNQLKDGLFDSLPAETQEFMSNNPEMLEKTWTTFLDMLIEAGYAAPEGVR